MLVPTFASCLAQQQPTVTVLQKLDPQVRAAVLILLVGLIVVGILLVAMVMLGARWARAGLQDRPATSDGSAPSRPPSAPLDPNVPAVPPASGDTLTGQASFETAPIEGRDE